MLEHGGGGICLDGLVVGFSFFLVFNFVFVSWFGGSVCWFFLMFFWFGCLFVDGF